MTRLRSAPGKRTWIFVPQAAFVVTGLVALVAVMNQWIGEPILFRCAKCDTDWDFGLRGHED